MPLIDENARTDADDIEPLEQVIDLNPSHVLPSVDENAVDSMDFENQLGYISRFAKCLLFGHYGLGRTVLLKCGKLFSEKPSIWRTKLL